MVALGFLRNARPLIIKSDNPKVVPLPYGKGGKPDFSKVPVGSSTWISIDNPNSPLHGRHVLITNTARGFTLGSRDSSQEAWNPAKNREVIAATEVEQAGKEDEHGIWGRYAGPPRPRLGVYSPFTDEDQEEDPDDLEKASDHWKTEPRDARGRWTRRAVSPMQATLPGIPAPQANQPEASGEGKATQQAQDTQSKDKTQQKPVQSVQEPSKQKPEVDEFGDAPDEGDEPGDLPARPRWSDKDDDQRELLEAIANASQKGSHDELEALKQLADGYGLSEKDIAEATGEDSDESGHDLRHEDIRDRMHAIENSVHGEVFKHFNKHGRLKKQNAYTGKRINARNAKGRLTADHDETWNLPGTGYDEVMDNALANHFGNDRNVGNDPTLDEFYDKATQLWKEHQRLKQLDREYSKGLHKSEDDTPEEGSSLSNSGSKEGSGLPNSGSKEGLGQHDGTDLWLHGAELADDRGFWNSLHKSGAWDTESRDEDGRWTTGAATAGQASNDEAEPEDEEQRAVKAVLPNATPGHLRGAYRGAFEVDLPTGKATLETMPRNVEAFAQKKGGAPGVKVKGDIVMGGKRVGSFERGIMKMPNGDLVAKHELLALNQKGLTGHGFGHEFNKQSEEFYKAQGVKRIMLQANITVGAYAWAKQGYDWADRETRDDAVQHFVVWAKSKHGVSIPPKAIQKLNDGHSWDLAGYDSGKQVPVESWDDNGRKSVDGNYPLGKAFLLSGALKNGWHGIKDLTPDSPSQKIYKKYLREKKAKLNKSLLLFRRTPTEE